MVCGNCGTVGRGGQRFCSRCGTALTLACPSCNAVNEPDDLFCGECGVPLASGPAAASSSSGDGGAPSAPERRLVTVLFADLVGFTTLAEHRDPEQVRELLSMYFDRCRTQIERHGGTVEKFIGDAVMAVWGSPVAHEDDAERAVRAGLALIQAVSDLGEELHIRVGVLTGNASVNLAGGDEAMVLGDTVNTASRLQALAAPGTVLVDDVTRRATEAAIAYEDAGTHEVKGREQPTRTWTALRVVAGTGGAMRGIGLEAPFVGRDTELHEIVEAGEASAATDTARLVTVVGEAGFGKSRLLWEYFKVVDGIQDLRWWHQGRCLSYGEGAAYWALAEMVRNRAGIAEDEPTPSARAKLTATVQEYVSDERERRLVEPRLAHLLGLEQRSAPDRADLFSGWRLFFERMAATGPVVLAFDDLQWADSGLLDFIDYLIEWSSEFPLFVLALGRSDVLAKRPGWTATITLEPLPDEAMASLLSGLVPGLPDELAARIRRRAEGVPLYAVETVRMLLDQDLLSQDGNRYVVTGDISDLEVPETLHALSAARLDNLEPVERAVLQDAAVLGQSFTLAAIAEIRGRSEAELAPVLEALRRKQVLSYEDDPRSLDAGQYVFVQSLLREVALGTLSLRERKAKHLVVAEYLRRAYGDRSVEVAEVLASHYLAAMEADPEADDVATIRAAAQQMLIDAGRRALSLALGPEARGHFEQAVLFADDPATRGRLLREAGAAARLADDTPDALRLLGEAADELNQAGFPQEAALAQADLMNLLRNNGQAEEARAIGREALVAIGDGGDDQATAAIAVNLAAVEWMTGNADEALRLAEIAARIAEHLQLPVLLSYAFSVRANVLSEAGRVVEALTLEQAALALAVEQEIPERVSVSRLNIADSLMFQGRYDDAQSILDEGLVFARQRGDRRSERALQSQRAIVLAELGDWDEAVDVAARVREGHDDNFSAISIWPLLDVGVGRSDSRRMEQLLDTLTAPNSWTVHELKRQVGLPVVLRALDRPEAEWRAAWEQSRTAIAQLLPLSDPHSASQFGQLVDCAAGTGDWDYVAGLLGHVDELKPAQVMPLLDGEAERARALLAGHEGRVDDAQRHFEHAITRLREIKATFHVARAQLEYAELLAGTEGHYVELTTLVSEAHPTFVRLGARPWIERTQGLALTPLVG